MLDNNRMDKLLYEKDLREELLTKKILTFMDSGLLVSRRSLEKEYQRNFTEFEINVIEFKPEMFRNQIKITDKEVSDYYELHKSEFQQKSQYALNYIILSVNHVKEGVIVRDREIEKYYQRNKNSEFSSNPSFHSRHILISAPGDNNEKELNAASALANKIFEQLKRNPERFAELAKEYSKDPASAKQGGDLGWVEQGTFVKEFDQVIKRLKKNEISKPFKTSFGFHIVELLDTKEAQTKSLESVKSDIVDKIQNKKAERRLKNKVSKLIKNLSHQSLRDIAIAEGVQIASSAPLDDSSKLNDLGDTYQLYQSLRQKKINDKGHFNFPGEKGTLIYEIDKVIEPFVKPLSSVTSEVKTLLRQEKEQKLSNVKLGEFAQEMKTFQSFNKLASSLRVQPRTISFNYSDTYVKSLSVGEGFRTEVFKMKEGQIKPIYDSGRGFLVHLAHKKSKSVADLDDKTAGNLMAQLRGYTANVVLNAFINQMKGKVTIEYNESLLKALNIRLNS